jgi:hypothetical protein
MTIAATVTIATMHRLVDARARILIDKPYQGLAAETKAAGRIRADEPA